MFAIITYLANVTMGKNHNHICFNYKKKVNEVAATELGKQ